jgi:hypothetical protein
MDASDIMNVLFHYGDALLRIGSNLDYVGGGEALLEIERNTRSLPELKGFLKHHVKPKE